MERDEDKRKANENNHKIKSNGKEMWNDYYNKTKNKDAHKNLKRLLLKEKPLPGKAIDIGCGTGADTIFLLENNWKVISIDSNDVEQRILHKLKDEQRKNFKFEQQKFEKIKLEKNNLVVANNSLSFCKREKFKELWDKIKESILPGGYFVGNFWGDKDEWKEKMKDKTFLTREDIEEMFKDFEILNHDIELEEDGFTDMKTPKHWHVFRVTARKK